MYLISRGLRGEEALKEFSKTGSTCLGLGHGTEGILYLRNGKRIKNVSDINKLTDKETIETAEKLTEKQASRYKNKAGRRLTENDIEEYISTGSNKAKYKKRKATKEGENLLLVNNDEIETFVTDAINGDIKNIEKAYGKPEARFIEDVKAATGGDVDISGYYLELNADDIKHSYDGHRIPKQAGDIPLSHKDYMNVADYIDDYDELMEIVPTKNGVRIILGKKINGYSVITEMVSDSKNAVKFKNMWGSEY